jgi:hypothetical protein
MVYYYKYYVFGHYPSSCPFFKKHNVSETGFCLRPQVKPIQLDPIDRASPYLRNVVFFKKWTRRWIMSKNIILVIIYHRHTRLNYFNIFMHNRNCALGELFKQH